MFANYHNLAFALLWGMKGQALLHIGEEVVQGREAQPQKAGCKMQEGKDHHAADSELRGRASQAGLWARQGFPEVPGGPEGVES